MVVPMIVLVVVDALIGKHRIRLFGLVLVAMLHVVVAIVVMITVGAMFVAMLVIFTVGAVLVAVSVCVRVAVRMAGDRLAHRPPESRDSNRDQHQ